MKFNIAVSQLTSLNPCPKWNPFMVASAGLRGTPFRPSIFTWMSEHKWGVECARISSEAIFDFVRTLERCSRCLLGKEPWGRSQGHFLLPQPVMPFAWTFQEDVLRQAQVQYDDEPTPIPDFKIPLKIFQTVRLWTWLQSLVPAEEWGWIEMQHLPIAQMHGS